MSLVLSPKTKSWALQKQTRFEQTPALFEMTQPHRGKGKLSIRQVRAWWCVCDTMLPISFWMFLIVFVALDGCYLGCACSLVIQVVIKCDNHWRREPAHVIIWSCVIMSQCHWQMSGLQFSVHAEHHAEPQRFVVQTHARHFDPPEGRT